MLDKFKGRSLSSITEQEVVCLSEDEQKALIEWALRVKLDHLIAEGIVQEITDNNQTKLYTICNLTI